MCLSTAVTALGMVMAGTGDIDSLRVMRELRARVEGEVSAGGGVGRDRGSLCVEGMYREGD